MHQTQNRISENGGKIMKCLNVLEIDPNLFRWKVIDLSQEKKCKNLSPLYVTKKIGNIYFNLNGNIMLSEILYIAKTHNDKTINKSYRKLI